MRRDGGRGTPGYNSLVSRCIPTCIPGCKSMYPGVQIYVPRGANLCTPTCIPGCKSMHPDVYPGVQIYAPRRVSRGANLCTPGCKSMHPAKRIKEEQPAGLVTHASAFDNTLRRKKLKKRRKKLKKRRRS